MSKLFDVRVPQDEPAMGSGASAHHAGLHDTHALRSGLDDLTEES